MKAPDQNGISTGVAMSASEEDRAVQSAENEAMALIPSFGHANLTVLDRISAYLKKKYASIKTGQDLTLVQLLAKLRAAGDNDRLLRKQSASLQFLIASDIKAAQGSPTQGASNTIARPMSAWRERYNGLDRFLPRPS